jgi:hypothetical protein
MQVYRHSGRCGLWGVPAASVAGVAAALVLGVVYAYGTNWIPFIYLNFLLTLGFGFAVGAAVVWGAKAGKIRNMPVATMVGGTVGVLAVYFAWVFDPMARVDVIGRPMWDVQFLWAYMKFGYANGFWAMGHNGDPVKGLMLASVWAGEATMIIGAAALTVRGLLGTQPFCEETNQWTTTAKNVARLSLVGDENVEAKLQRLLEGDVDALGEFYRAGEGDPAVLQLDLATCRDCPTCNYLTIRSVRSVVNKKGEVSKQEQELLVNLQVAPEDVAKIHAAGVDRPVEPAAAEPAPEV